MQTSPLERAQTLFAALDIDLDGTLTLDDFVKGYMERSVLMAKQVNLAFNFTLFEQYK